MGEEHLLLWGTALPVQQLSEFTKLHSPLPQAPLAYGPVLLQNSLCQIVTKGNVTICKDISATICPARTGMLQFLCWNQALWRWKGSPFTHTALWITYFYGFLPRAFTECYPKQTLCSDTGPAEHPKSLGHHGHTAGSKALQPEMTKCDCLLPTYTLRISASSCFL